jgi:ribonuclease J
MRLRIHHGAAEIGGNCIELESGGQTLLLDLGLPLDSAPVMPDVPGLTASDPNFLGVVLSHPHLDHYGLLLHANAATPVWLGEQADRLLKAAAPFARGSALPQAVTPYRTGETFSVGPFQITAYLMDHSAFDAHSLLVEAGGKRVFYTGDFRGHGRKAAVFERFLAAPPPDIDLLLMEGTTLGRDEAPVSEHDVEEEACQLMQDTAGLVLACFSGQNIDRFVTFLRASMRAGRIFVIDAYMATLIDALALASLPDVTAHPSLRIFLPASQRRAIIAQQRFDLVDRVRRRRIYREELLAYPKRFTLMFRAGMIDDLGAADLTGGACLYSLWPGYLERDRIDLRDWARDRGIAFHLVHSSGHAHRGDLERMVKAIAPGRLMPVHTAHPERYEALYQPVQYTQNGSWVGV